MKKIINLSYYISGLALLFMMPQITNAAPAAPVGIKFSLTNYLIFDSIESLVVGILQILIVIAIPIIVLFIIYSGFLYVTAQGNPAQITQATQSLTYSIIGGVLVLGAVALSQVIANIVKAFST
ncbi:MAG: Type secretion system pilin [Candidatus Parcubacteria bacterium]|jgi:hypothetical protein